MRTTFTVLLISAQSLFGATYYIATTGSDAADGSSGTPWLTISKAMTTVVAGDTVNVAAGTYSGSATTSTDGTGASPITFSGTATTNAILTGILTATKSNYRFNNFTFKDNRAFSASGPNPTNWTISNCYFTNTTPQSFNLTRSGSVTNGPKDWKIIFNRFDNWAGGTTLTLTGERHLIRSNRFERCEQSWDVMGIYGDGHIIADNYFANLVSGASATPPNARHADIIQFFDGATNPWEYGSRSNTFARNYVTNSGYQFGNATADNGSTNFGPWWIYNNVFVDSRTQWNGETPYMNFYHNTIVSSTTTYGLRFSDSTVTGGADNGRVINNIFARIFSFSYVSNSVTNFTANGNWFSSAADGAFNASVVDGAFGNTNGFNPSDIFIDFAAGDFRIKSGASMIGKGTNALDLVTDDYHGTARGAAPTPGAYEFVEYVITTPARLGPGKFIGGGSTGRR